MKKILAFSLLFLPLLANAQCPQPLSLTQLQTVFKAESKEDILLGWGFDKTDEGTDDEGDGWLSFGRCRKTLLKKDDLTCSNFNESVFISDNGSMIYGTFDRNRYLSIKNFVKINYKSIGENDIKGDLYTKNAITYGFKVDIWPTDCGNTNNFSIWLSSAK